MSEFMFFFFFRLYNCKEKQKTKQTKRSKILFFLPLKIKAFIPCNCVDAFGVNT